MWMRRMASAAGSSFKRKSSDSAGSATKKPAGHWAMGLKTSMEDPELKVDEDDKIVIIKDKYPKARFHFLLLPKQNIVSLKRLTKEHLPLLEYMQERGEKLAEKSSSELDFRCGYHAIPSMSHIHLHVISQDFDSPCLKTKKHWNSFTSEYFLDSTDVIKLLKEKGEVKVDTSKYEQILKRDLRCHVCKKAQTNMPTLKKHILQHVPKSSGK